MAEKKAKMKYIPLEEIKVGERFREDFGDLDGLKESIREKGLIQPISVSNEMELLAGGRRYEACRQLGFKSIPALIRDNVDEIDAREVELVENVFRKDFTWQERSRLTAEIDRLYREKDPTWNQRKTASLLERGLGSISRDVQLAQAIKAIPELGEHKTADDALKALKKMEEEVIIAELAKRQAAINAAGDGDEDINEDGWGEGVVQINAVPEKRTTFRPFDLEKVVRDVYRRADNCYRISDVFDGMASMRTNGHIEFIECDPPYGIDLTEQKGSKDSVDSTIHGYQEIASNEYEAFLKKLTTELYRVAGRDCWMIFWFGPSWHTQVKAALESAGWLVDDIPAIWTKFQGQTLQPEIYLARCYEPFFVCRKGKPILAMRGCSNVFSYAGVPAAEKYHPTERPQSLLVALLKTFCIPGTRVFIPFLGSGATLRACITENLTAHGYDINDQYKPRFLLKVEEDIRKSAAILLQTSNGPDKLEGMAVDKNQE